MSNWRLSIWTETAPIDSRWQFEGEVCQTEIRTILKNIIKLCKPLTNVTKINWFAPVLIKSWFWKKGKWGTNINLTFWKVGQTSTNLLSYFSQLIYNHVRKCKYETVLVKIRIKKRLQNQILEIVYIQINNHDNAQFM